jgi:tripartite-type tricarboxylate transporter receptor subunit TctC
MREWLSRHVCPPVPLGSLGRWGSSAGWDGLFAPKGTPNEIIDRLNAATIQGLAEPLVRSRLADLGLEIFPREQQTPAAFAAFQKAQIEKWWPLIKQLRIKAE